MVRATGLWIGIVPAALVFLAVGCQPQGNPRASSVSHIPTHEREALGKLDEFIQLGKAVGKANDLELLGRMQQITWAMALAGGYDFRDDFDLWDLWRAWLEERDFTVTRKCLDSNNPIAITLGIDIAMEGGRKQDIDYVMRRYEDSAISANDDMRRAYRWTIGVWLKYHRPISDVGGDGGCERVVRPTEEFYKSLLQVMRPHEKTLQQIKERLRSQQ